MADPRVVSIFTIIFTFVEFNAIRTFEGRSIKLAWQDELHAVNNDQMNERASQSVTPSRDHSDGRKETVPSPTAYDKVVSSGDLEAVDDFRPSTPGNSPGEGHYFVGSKKGGAQLKALRGDEERLTVTRTLGDFQATVQGHSPGVGHSFVGSKKGATVQGHSPGVGHSFVGSKKGGAQLKALSGDEERLTVTRTLGDFRATGQGHSPGVGHVFQSKNDEPIA